MSIVDDHQVDFCLKIAELGRVRLAQTPAEFASSWTRRRAIGLRSGHVCQLRTSMRPWRDSVNW